MKKKLSIILLTIVALISFPNYCKAASANINVSANRSSVVVGQTIKVTVTLSSASNLGAWQFDVNYDKAKLQILSSSDTPTVVESTDSPTRKTKTYTYNFKAIASGNASISISDASVLGYDENSMSVSKGSKTIKIMTQSELEATYSKNNYLSSLTVEGAAISPAFNKETLEYVVELEPNTEKIIVNATKEDSKATLEGGGEIPVSEGENNIEIKVTAENGNVRVYKIKAIVKELAPINITLNGNNYTVVRKKEFLEKPTSFTETTTIINNEEVPAFYNETVDILLVGLKNSEGNISLYQYDINSNNFTPYQEFVFDYIMLNIKTVKDIPKNYHKTTITINEKEVEAYKLKDSSRFALVYGVNLENNHETWYMYDTIDHTLQVYNIEEIKLLTQKNKDYYNALIVLTILLVLTFITLILVFIFKGKNKKKTKKSKEKILNNIEKTT